MGNIQLAADAIAAKVQEVSGIKTVETRPKFSTSRKLPAIFVTYVGFKQTPLTYRSHAMVYKFLLTLYFKVEGRNLEDQWDRILDLSNEIVDTFRNSITLDGVAMMAEITDGKPVIDIPRNPDAKPNWLGHRYDLEITFEES